MTNKEEGIKNRFKSHALLDDIVVVACMVYVDLNPVRAAMASTPEESDFTSTTCQLFDAVDLKGLWLAFLYTSQSVRKSNKGSKTACAKRDFDQLLTA
jgi:hypothetical protein